MPPESGSAAVADAVTAAYRQEWPTVVASVARVTRDLDLAEDCAQEAFASALTRWSATGVPDRPGAWLTTVARNHALDVLRRKGRAARLLPLLVMDQSTARGDPGDRAGTGVDDDRLRLILTCCHPALDRPAQVALTLRLVCGLSTSEVARAFLVPQPTMAARITRAKKKIAVARIPFRIPDDDRLPERLDAVLQVVYLVFTTGHAAPSGASAVRDDLADTALRLARLLHDLMPHDARVAAMLALMLLTSARRGTRVAATGEPVALPEQDRSRWDRAMIAEGATLVRRSLRSRPTRYGLEAAIAAVHAQAGEWQSTDWAEIVDLYDLLAQQWPSPVVGLNRAVAVGFRDGPEAGLQALAPLIADPIAQVYPYVAAAHADLLRRAGRAEEARQAYRTAIDLTENAAERAGLQRRLDALT
ncbi:sigma-70 family RNA polymerase sigma factor [Microbacterium sp. dk485]|uniref:RNA polymerase sigma factor n=1 Tax=Microbacterium sp. dk485 TaxID=2560021 RepID=UPI00107346C9|nr:sigma-70 family RNA polymerase sigma factor [Microbacterium sp. dk485]TFV84538.1 sigma-70 family RNA polymerase sigma factor [Microbacterium sp. dk485]